MLDDSNSFSLQSSKHVWICFISACATISIACTLWKLQRVTSQICTSETIGSINTITHVVIVIMLFIGMYVSFLLRDKKKTKMEKKNPCHVQSRGSITLFKYHAL